MTAQAGGAIPSSQDAQAIAAERNALRKQLRRTRHALSRSERIHASVTIARRLARHPMIKPGTRIGVYLAVSGELNLRPFIEVAWQRGCQLFVPHITHARRRQMAFFPLVADSRLQTHRWGMPQLVNAGRQISRSDCLDVVLVPLLGFDAQGNRLGMGGGFYDRHFARLTRARRWHRPHLIGVAYACQQVSRLSSQPHDVQLEQIVTERGVLRVQMR